MKNYELGLFLEDVDLLDLLEFSSLQNDEVINEVTIIGMKITKENLEDENFVKNLIKEIRNNKHKLRDNINAILVIAGIISVVTIITAPIGFLLIALSSVIKDSDKINDKDLKKLDDTFEKTITKFNKKLNKVKNEKDKKELKEIIEKLESNREFIYNRAEEERIRKLINLSKYDEYYNIKVGSTTLSCEITHILSSKPGKLYEYCKDTTLNDIKSEFKLYKDNVFRRLEHLTVNGIKSRADLINYLKDKRKHDANHMEINEYGDKVIKYLKDKTVSIIIELDDDGNNILYCYEDDCCYIWYGSEDNEIYKVSINDLLQASKTSYEDLLKLVSAVK